MTRPRPRLSRTTTAILLAVLLTVGFTAATVAPAAATHEDGDDGGLGAALTPSDDSFIGGVLGTVYGGVDRMFYAIRGPDGTASENLDEAITTFNNDDDTLRAYANNRSVHEGEVLEVECQLDGETATGYIVANYSDSNDEYSTAEAVHSTDRAVDETVTLRKNACDNAAEELEYFIDEFASQDRDITKKYENKMKAKYAGNVDEPFTGGAG